MGSFMTNRFAGGNTHHILKQDLITQAKQRCHELGGNAIVECKMAISRGKYCYCIKSITFDWEKHVELQPCSLQELLDQGGLMDPKVEICHICSLKL